jgi:hypothetical protein
MQNLRVRALASSHLPFDAPSLQNFVTSLTASLQRAASGACGLALLRVWLDDGAAFGFAAALEDAAQPVVADAARRKQPAAVITLICPPMFLAVLIIVTPSVFNSF